MSINPSPVPDKLWEAFPQIAGKLRNEFLLFTLGFVLLVIAIGAFAPAVVALLGRGLFYLLVVLAFLAYVGLRVLDTWSKMRSAKREERETSSPAPAQKREPLIGTSETSSSIISSGDHNINVTGGVQGGITVNYGGTPPVEPVARPQEEYDLEAVRELLGAAFSDQEIVTLAFDRFRRVYEDLTGEMSKTTKIRLLVDWCNERVVLDELLAAVEQRNPNQYARYAARLKRR